MICCRVQHTREPPPCVCFDYFCHALLFWSSERRLMPGRKHRGPGLLFSFLVNLLCGLEEGVMGGSGVGVTRRIRGDSQFSCISQILQI